MLAGSINTNIDALYALQALQNTSNTTDTLEQELSSGLAINGPQDNPAGYIAAQGFTTQLDGTTQAISNANQAISLLQTANGAITQQVNILQQISTTADQAANGLNSAQQLQSLQGVVSQLQTQISTIASQSVFGGLNLLNGSLNGVQFQVGASEGQTIGLSVPSTLANQLGANQSSALTTSGPYKVNGVGTGGVGDVTGSSYAISSGGVGAFTAGTIGVSGSAGAKSITVTANESAEDIAASVNAITSNTNVSAVANTSVAFTVTSGSVSFTLGNGNGGAQTNDVNIAATVTSVSQTGLQSLVQAINQETGTTGVTATVNSDNQLVLSQAQGDNISIADFAGTGTLAAGGSTTVTLGTGGGDATAATVQGLVTLQSSNTFALSSAASDIGLQTTSGLTTLAAQNVSTISGANAAINVVAFALQQLENIGSQLGAVEQALQATASNLQTTQTNVTAAQSVVQDANVPQVTTQLTQEQILAQAGVSALAQSSTLEQSFLKLLQ
ncbi:MAG TPA: flagellin [Stellaceae bacterium]|nr:flagellin [Stellaceae bacterium]